MSSSDEQKPKSAGERMLENFLRGGFVSDEESERRAQAWEELEGTSRESAYLNDESMLVMHYWSLKDNVTGDGWAHYMPGEDWRQAR